MPSRKKAKAKAKDKGRRAAKEAAKAVVPANQLQEGSLKAKALLQQSMGTASTVVLYYNVMMMRRVAI